MATKKTIRDNVFDSTGATDPLCVAHEDHIEVARIRVDKNGARGLTIEEQVAQLRTRLAWADADVERLGKLRDTLLGEIQILKAKLRKARRRK